MRLRSGVECSYADERCYSYRADRGYRTTSAGGHGLAGPGWVVIALAGAGRAMYRRLALVSLWWLGSAWAGLRGRNGAGLVDVGDGLRTKDNWFGQPGQLDGHPGLTRKGWCSPVSWFTPLPWCSRMGWFRCPPVPPLYAAAATAATSVNRFTCVASARTGNAGTILRQQGYTRVRRKNTP